MNDMRVAVIMRLVNRMRGPARQAVDDLERIERQTGRTNRRLANMARYGTRGVLAFVAATGASIRTAAGMEDAWSEANKTLELAPDQLEQLQDQVEELAQKVPLATRELVEMAGAAGQIGVRGDDLLPFMEDAAVMAATFDIHAAQAASTMGAWREQMQWSQDEIRLFADKINLMGNTTNASSDKLAAFSSRVLDLAGGSSDAADALLAIGTSMIAMNREPEVAATSARATINRLSLGVDQLTASQLAMVESMGLDWAEVQLTASTDWGEALQMVVGAISDLPPEMRRAAATEIFGDEARRGAGELLTDIEELDRSLGRVGEMSMASGSMQGEFDALSNDVLDNWQRVKNAFGARMNDFGGLFLERLNELLIATADFLTNLDEHVARMKVVLQPFIDVLQRVGETAHQIIETIWLPIRASLEGFFDGLSEWLRPISDKLSSSFERVLNIFERVGDIIGNLATQLGLIEGGGGLAALRELGEGLGYLFGAVVNLAYGALDNALFFIEGIVTFIAKLTAGDVYGAFEPVMDFFGWLGSLALNGLADAISSAREFFDWLSSLTLTDILPDWDFSSVTEFFTNLFTFNWDEIFPDVDWRSIFELSGSELFEIGFDIIMAIMDGMISAFADLLEWVAKIPEKIYAAIGQMTFDVVFNPIMGGIRNNVSSDPSGLGIRTGSTPGAERPDEDALRDLYGLQERASGGSYDQGWRLVGERGPELEYVNRAGFIAHHGQLRRMVEMSDTVRRNMRTSRPVQSSRARSARSVQVGDIHVHAAPGMDEARLARLVRREIDRRALSGDELHDGGFYVA